jgi:chorismate--pyruvate lyase
LNKINNFFIKQPVWRDVKRCSVRSIAPHILNWLLEPGSLTLRIKHTFSDTFNVQVEAQGLSRPFLEDAKTLRRRPYEYALVREVVLRVGEQSVVFARTTLPRKVADDLQELTHLGAKSLGNIIFSYRDLTRVGLDIAKIRVDHLTPMMQTLCAGQRYLWARRNIYQINNRSFIVSEFFLPAIYKVDTAESHFLPF